MPFRVPLLVGNTKGRDHFQYPVTTADGGASDPQFFPLQVPTSKACKWLWRVKKWKINGTLTLDFEGTDDSAVPSGGGAPVDFTFAGSVTLTLTDLELVMMMNNGDSPLDERRILNWLNGPTDPIHGGPNYGNLGCRLDPFGAAGDTFDSDISMTGGAAQDPDRAYTNEGNQYLSNDSQISGGDDSPGFANIFWTEALGVMPCVEFDIKMTSSWKRHSIVSSPNDRLWDMVTRINAAASLPTGYTLVGDVAVDSVSANVYGQVSKVNVDPPTTNVIITSSTISDCSFTIAPSEFWPFKNRLGQLVYDTTSGAQLNDPFA